MKLDYIILFTVGLSLVTMVTGGVYQDANSHVVPGEYMILLRRNIPVRKSHETEQRVREARGVQVLQKYTLGKRIYVRVHADDVTDVKKLLTIDDIEMIGPNDFVSNDPLIDQKPVAPSQLVKPKVQSIEGGPGSLRPESNCHLSYVGELGWGLTRTSWRQKPVDWENTPYVWGDEDSGEGVDAYIVDTGIKITHTEFEDRAFWGVTGPFSRVGEPDDDLNGHGTHIAGTIIGKDYGLAKKAHAYAVKVLNRFGLAPWSDTIYGLEWIINRVNQLKAKGKVPRSVINMSLSSPGLHQMLETAIQETVEAGVVFCNSAGNTASDTCGRTPARMGSTMSVGASNINDTLPEWSNHGPCTAINAPGQNIIGPAIESDTAFAVFSGTSMSTPHVAGMAARYLSSLPDPVAAVTSPARVQAALSDVSTKNVLGLVDLARRASPNHLLYKMCDNRRMRQLEPETTTPGFRTPLPATTTTASGPETPAPTKVTEVNGVRQEDVGGLALGLLGVSGGVIGVAFGLFALLHVIYDTVKREDENPLIKYDQRYDPSPYRDSYTERL